MRTSTIMVFNLRTGEERHYSLSLGAEEAVRTAYQQVNLRSYAWYSPATQAKTPPVEDMGRVVACGDWSACRPRIEQGELPW